VDNSGIALVVTEENHRLDSFYTTMKEAKTLQVLKVCLLLHGKSFNECSFLIEEVIKAFCITGCKYMKGYLLVPYHSLLPRNKNHSSRGCILFNPDRNSLRIHLLQF
jgi:hypothetical protein